MTSCIELGLGLIGIGKPWGYADATVPDDAGALRLLETALDLGIRYFDTAPSYGDGLSERRLGIFLRSLGSGGRRGITVATKFGERWDREGGQPAIDHSYDALRRSLDETIARLGLPDILQLHRTNPDALRSEDLDRAWEYASGLGIAARAASVSDPVSADIVLGEPRYTLVQLPYNVENRAFEPTIARALRQQVRIAVNRPFGMGKLFHETALTAREAFAFVLSMPFSGVILTGTKSPAHLRENVSAFRDALGNKC